MQTRDIPLNALSPGKGAGSGRPCAICQLPLKVRSALEERIARGESVKSTWRWALKQFPEVSGTNYDTVARHQRLHTGPVKRAAKKLSDADKMVRSQIRLARDVLADKIDPQAYFGPAAIAQDIAKTSVRLDAAADSAFADGEHTSLASLSGQLLRATELRAKMGGSIQDGAQVNLSVTLAELHGRLDAVLGAPDIERHHVARALLGLDSPLTSSLSASADPHVRRQPFADPTNPLGEPLTIDVESNPTPSGSVAEPAAAPRSPLTRPMARRVETIHAPDAAPPAAPDDGTPAPASRSGEPLGPRWR